jgi:hypothetical protein
VSLNALASANVINIKLSTECNYLKILYSFLPFPSTLQLRASFGLLNNQPPFLSILLLSILSLPFYGDHHIPPPTIC